MHRFHEVRMKKPADFTIGGVWQPGGFFATKTWRYLLSRSLDSITEAENSGGLCPRPDDHLAFLRKIDFEPIPKPSQRGRPSAGGWWRVPFSAKTRKITSVPRPFWDRFLVFECCSLLGFYSERNSFGLVFCCFWLGVRNKK